MLYQTFPSTARLLSTYLVTMWTKSLQNHIFILEDIVFRSCIFTQNKLEKDLTFKRDSEFLGNFWEIFEKFLGILWEFFGNSFGILNCTLTQNCEWDMKWCKFWLKDRQDRTRTTNQILRSALEANLNKIFKCEFKSGFGPIVYLLILLCDISGIVTPTFTSILFLTFWKLKTRKTRIDRCYLQYIWLIFYGTWPYFL